MPTWENYEENGGRADLGKAGKVHSAQQGLHLKLRQETEDSKVVVWILRFFFFFNFLVLGMKPSPAYPSPLRVRILIQ